MQAGSNGYVLVIDDQKGLRALLAEVLRLQGIRVVTASNGCEGRAAARECPPDMILVDMKMPGMDGLDTIRAIREDGILAPCYLMTALDHNTRIQEALHLPRVALLAKPFDISTVRILVAQDLTDGVWA